MVKIYKSPKGKLVIYLPFDVISELGLKDSDEVDFFKMNDSSYIFAKKSDITDLILGRQPQAMPAKSQPAPQPQQRPQGQMPEENITVLKKIDTLRYNERTPENVSKLLTEQEKRILQKMISEKIVNMFTKDSKRTYSISKSVYDRFLMRKKPQAQPAPAPQQRPQAQQPRFQPQQRPQFGASNAMEDENIKSLEKDGFVVLQTEAEAGRASLALEQSIRHGQVLGTRAFNKKFYIVMRTYFDKNSSAILKKLREKAWKVSDLSSELSIDEEGVRGILYLLSENGDVSEKKRDTFTIA
jgi:hypothetical protein